MERFLIRSGAFLLLGVGIALADCDSYPGLFHDENGMRVILRVPSDALVKAPTWTQVDDPPLSLAKALAIARRHAASRDKSSSLELHEIVITPVTCTDGQRAYYVFRFGPVSEARGWQTFAVLFDGTVIDPQPHSESPPNTSLERTRKK